MPGPPPVLGASRRALFVCDFLLTPPATPAILTRCGLAVWRQAPGAATRPADRS